MLRGGRLVHGARMLAERPLHRLLHLYFRFARGLTLGVRGAALDERGRVCLVRHTYLQGWHLPGGGVEAGETALCALRREMAEEACLDIPDAPEARPVLHGVFFNDRASRRDHVLVYVVRDFRRLGERAPDREILEARFFPLDALPADISPATRVRLDEIASGRPPPERW